VSPGTLVLFPFPQTDLELGKLRPALLLAPVPGEFRDWLAAMVTSQARLAVEGFDEIIAVEDDDFVASGLKTTSVLRLGRLAVMAETLIVGVLGEIGPQRLQRIRERLARWIQDPQQFLRPGLAAAPGEA